MSSTSESPGQPPKALARWVTDLSVATLLVAVLAVVIAPHLKKQDVPQEEDHIQKVTTAAGSLQSAASLERAERLTRGMTVKRDFDAPRTGALRVIPRPIAAEDCARMWNDLMPEGPTASTGLDALFIVDPTDERGVCLYRYTATNNEAHVISYRPESGQVGYD